MPIRRQDGAAWTNNLSARNLANSYNTPLYRGDVLVSLGSGYVAQATPGTTQVAGIFMGCRYLSLSQGHSLWLPFFSGNGDVNTNSVIDVFMVDDPSVLFKVQCNGGPVTQANIGNNANFAIGTGSSGTGLSGATLDVSTIATTATLPFRIVRLVTSVENGGDPTTAYNEVEVAFNNQDFKSLTGI
jgi:hypothetical protein